MREPRELDPFLFRLLPGVPHQPAQVRVPTAGHVGLSVNVAEIIHTGRALKRQRLPHQRAQFI